MPPKNRPGGIYPIGPGGRRRPEAREIWVVPFARIRHVRKALQRKVLGRNSPVFWQMRRQCCAILRYYPWTTRHQRDDTPRPLDATNPRSRNVRKSAWTVRLAGESGTWW